MMRLHYADTLKSRLACAVARHLRLPVEFVPVDLGRGEHKRPEYLAINPNGKVPVLEDGGRTIWEASAIIVHLAVRAGSGLWPREPDSQVEVVRWMSWHSEHFLVAGGELYFQRIIRPRFGLGEPDETAVARATKDWRRHAAVLEAHLDGRDWLLGAPSLADFTVASALPYATEAKIPLPEFPRIASWYARLDALPGWRDPYPAIAAAA